MADNNPFLFAHLPLDGVRGFQTLDVSSNRRHGFPYHTKIAADETFGACLEFAPDSYVKFPAWKLTPAVFLPRAANNPPPGALLKLTFTLWLTLPSTPKGEWSLINAGLGKDLQRFTVGFSRQDDSTLRFTVQTPAQLDKTRGFRWTGESTAAHGPWAHFAVVWDPKGEGADAGYGICRMFLNGAPVAIIGRSEGAAPIPVAGVHQTLLCWQGFSGKLAHLRVYTRELTEEEIAQEIDRDLAGQRKSGLIELSLLDPIERPRMFLSSPSAPVAEKMTVAVKPLRRAMKLARPPAGPVVPNSCHFEIQFRPGVLTLRRSPSLAVTSQPPATWEAKELHFGPPGQHVSVCIRCNSGMHLAENVQLKMVLDSLLADAQFGERWTRIDLRYHIDDDQGNRYSGRIPQWLKLAPRHPSPSPVLSVGLDWTQDPGTALSVTSGNTLLQGRLVCADAQGMMKRHLWKPERGRVYPDFQYHLVLRLPAGYTPWPKNDLRFPGRAQWLSRSPQPQTLQRSDLFISSDGQLGIVADLPLDLYDSVGRIELSLDGVSYASEESVMKAGET